MPQIKIEGVTPIPEIAYEHLTEEAKECWKRVDESDPPTYIPRGFTMITTHGDPLNGMAVPTYRHKGRETSLESNYY